MISYNQPIIPQDYLCPITHEIMKNPVIAADGHTYEEKSIIEWLSRGNRRSPLNGNNLPHTILLENIFAKKIINEFNKKLPQEIIEKGVKSNLEQCIKLKEEMIMSLIEKIDQINTNQRNPLINFNSDMQKEIENWKNQVSQKDIII